MDWLEVEKQLSGRAEEVCRHLLPEGRREGPEWVCGSVNGEAGRSLKVNLNGKAGMWRDFAGDKGGKTLMSLWCSVRGVAFKVCIVEAKKFLGLEDDWQRERRVQPANSDGGPQRRAGPTEESSWKAVAEIWGKCQALTEGGPVWKYLVEERRIEPQVLDWYGVRELISANRWVMVFPYYVAHRANGMDGPHGVLSLPDGGNGGERMPSWLKFERLDRPEGRKIEWTSKGPEKCLWGMPVGERVEAQKANDVLICEGEKDALSWASYGALAWGLLPVSVPFGAKWRPPADGSRMGRPSPNREWLDRCWDWLQGYESVYVAMDSDEAGRRAAADVIAEIGPRRCRLVELPERKNVTGANGGNRG